MQVAFDLVDSNDLNVDAQLSADAVELVVDAKVVVERYAPRFRLPSA